MLAAAALNPHRGAAPPHHSSKCSVDYPAKKKKKKQQEEYSGRFLTVLFVLATFELNAKICFTQIPVLLKGRGLKAEFWRVTFLLI